MHKWDSSLSIKRVKKPPTTTAILADPPVHECPCYHARFNHVQTKLCYCDLGCEDKQPVTRKFKPAQVTHLYEFDGLISTRTLIALLTENFESEAALLDVQWNRGEGNLRVSVVTVQDDE